MNNIKIYKNFQNESRKFKNKIMTISDFLFDNFFGDKGGYNVNTSDSIIKNIKNIKYKISLRFSFYSRTQSMKIEDLDRMKKCLTFIENYCENNSLKFYFKYGNTLDINFNIDNLNIEKIKSLPEFISWETNNINNHEIFMAKKLTRKYNL